MDLFNFMFLNAISMLMNATFLAAALNNSLKSVAYASSPFGYLIDILSTKYLK